jgi:hypothetical protein
LSQICDNLYRGAVATRRQKTGAPFITKIEAFLAAARVAILAPFSLSPFYDSLAAGGIIAGHTVRHP